eukprot:5793439-Amphidinium_carterae.1
MSWQTGVEHTRSQANGLAQMAQDGPAQMAQGQSLDLGESADDDARDCGVNSGNGTELQWTSPVTIMNSSVTMTVENKARQLTSSTMSTLTSLTVTLS